MAAVGAVTSPATPATAAASISSSSSSRSRLRLLPARFSAAASVRARCSPAAAAADGGATDAEDPAATATTAADGGPEAGTDVAGGAATSTRPPDSLISAGNVQKAMRGLEITEADHYERLGITRLASTDEEPEYEYATKLVGYFFLAWFIISVTCSLILIR